MRIDDLHHNLSHHNLRQYFDIGSAGLSETDQDSEFNPASTYGLYSAQAGITSTLVSHKSARRTLNFRHNQLNISIMITY